MDPENYTEEELRKVLEQCFDIISVDTIMGALVEYDQATISRYRVQKRKMNAQINQWVSQYMALAQDQRLAFLGKIGRQEIKVSDRERNDEVARMRQKIKTDLEIT